MTISRPSPFLVATCCAAVIVSAWAILPRADDDRPTTTPIASDATASGASMASSTGAVAAVGAATAVESPASDPDLARGVELHDVRLYRDARPLLERALAADPANHEARYYLGLTLLELRELERAEELFEVAVDADPDNADYTFGLAQAIGMQIGGTANPITLMSLATRSKRLLDRAIELDGGLLDARLGRIMFFLMAPGLLGGGKDKAQAEAEAIGVENEAVGLFALGWLAEEDGDSAAAEDLHGRAIALDPDYPRVRHRLGYLLLAQRRYAEAREQFEEYARIEPNNPFAHEGLAQCLLGQGDTERAIESAARSVELDPLFHQGVFRLAACRDRAGDDELARADYERFLELAGDRESEAQRVSQARDWLQRHAPE